MADAAFYAKAAAFAKEHNIHLIHDFAYGAFEFDQKPASFLEAEDAKTVGAELYSFSKHLTWPAGEWRLRLGTKNHSGRQ